jgi:hypothetical protein
MGHKYFEAGPASKNCGIVLLLLLLLLCHCCCCVTAAAPALPAHRGTVVLLLQWQYA